MTEDDNGMFLLCLQAMIYDTKPWTDAINLFLLRTNLSKDVLNVYINAHDSFLSQRDKTNNF